VILTDSGSTPYDVINDVMKFSTSEISNGVIMCLERVVRSSSCLILDAASEPRRLAAYC